MSKANNDRLQAYECLQACILSNKPLAMVLATTPNLSPYAKFLSFEVCRHYYRLHAILKLLVKKNPKSEIELLIMIGLYELHFANKPDYAVVKEIVNILHQTKKIWAKGFVNAVLREFCREKNTILENLKNNDAFIFGQQPWIINKLKHQYPNDWENILFSLDEHPPLTLRVNQQKISREDYLLKLDALNLSYEPCQLSNWGIRVAPDTVIKDLPGFMAGWVSVQDEAAQCASGAIPLIPKARILDACAAPGGKTLHMLEREPSINLLALDISAHRIKKIQENITRIGLNAEVKCADVNDVSAWWDGVLFDAILLDAPCTATGVIRRQPDVRIHRTPEELNHITSLQRSMLETLWPLLKPKGYLLYATCSIFHEENEGQMNAFMASHSDVYRHPMGGQTLPGFELQDGFFYALLQKQ